MPAAPGAESADVVASVQEDEVRQRARQARAEGYGAAVDRGGEDAVDVARAAGAVPVSRENGFNLSAHFDMYMC